MNQFIGFIFLASLIQMNYACFITNCPIGGKRSLSFGNSLRRHQCPQCGTNGQCFGPSICCNGLVCRIGHPSDTRQCSKENHSSTPCEINSPFCPTVPNGRCAANGVCCGIDSCHADKTCLLVPNQESDNFREESLVRSEIASFD